MGFEETPEGLYRMRVTELARLAKTTSDPAVTIQLLAIAKQFHRLADYVANENERAIGHDLKRGRVLRGDKKARRSVASRQT